MEKDTGFIKVTKDGATIEISPLALADHRALGWVLLDEDMANAQAADALAAKEKAEADALAAQEKAAAENKADITKAEADAKAAKVKAAPASEAALKKAEADAKVARKKAEAESKRE
jgi:hypothetical protein